MGKDGDECVVDPDFRMRGVKGLRVVDHSVMPGLITNHSQSTCYLILSLLN
jgi:choline dehydrogenase-like flavoprotein